MTAACDDVESWSKEGQSNVVFAVCDMIGPDLAQQDSQATSFDSESKIDKRLATTDDELARYLAIPNSIWEC